MPSYSARVVVGCRRERSGGTGRRWERGCRGGEGSDEVVPVLWLCRPPGVGKTAVGWEIEEAADVILAQSGWPGLVD